MVAFLYCRRFSPDMVELSNMVVASEARRGGVGARMVGMLEPQLVALGFRAAIFVNCRLHVGATDAGAAAARAFWLHHGYRIIFSTQGSAVFAKFLADAGPRLPGRVGPPRRHVSTGRLAPAAGPCHTRTARITSAGTASARGALQSVYICAIKVHGLRPMTMTVVCVLWPPTSCAGVGRHPRRRPPRDCRFRSGRTLAPPVYAIPWAAMFIFLIAVIRLVRSRLWRWRSMGRVRLVLLLLGLAWRLAVATRARKASHSTGGRHKTPHRRSGPALSNSRGARARRWAVSVASRPIK